MPAKVFIQGFAFSSYRSFGPDKQVLAPLAGINLLIGPNNSGKSNILRYIKEHLKPNVSALTAAKLPTPFTGADRCLLTDEPSGFDLCLGTAVASLEACLEKTVPNDQLPKLQLLLLGRESPPQAENPVARVTLRDGKKPAHIATSGAGNPVEYHVTVHRLLQSLMPLFSLSSSSPISINDLAPHLLRSMLARLKPIPDVAAMSAFRSVPESKTGNWEPGFPGGLGLLQLLGQLQSPTHTNRADEAKFRAVNRFFQTVTDEPDARIHIPFQATEIEVVIRNQPLPLSALGSGITQVVMIAAAATVLENQIVCIEEPECHLHPLLQRRLIQYLRDETTNQYFIATHSAHFLDLEGVAVFRIQNGENGSTITHTASPAERFQICSDLGYRASDLLQANCIIWVEGPSDRIYLRHWIKLSDSSLQEGIHFSIMFYGGRLLFHLSADDPSVNDFINLRRLNQNLAIVIDSDKRSEGDPLNSTKERVIREIGSQPGLAWVTAGRQIENYLDPERVEAAARRLYPTAEKFDIPKKPFDGSPRYAPGQHPSSERREYLDIDKVRLAHELVSDGLDLDRLDLRAQVEQLVDFIRTSNGLRKTKPGRANLE